MQLFLCVLGMTTVGCPEEALKVSWKLGLDDLGVKCSVCGNAQKQRRRTQDVKALKIEGCAML